MTKIEMKSTVVTIPTKHKWEFSNQHRYFLWRFTNFSGALNFPKIQEITEKFGGLTVMLLFGLSFATVIFTNVTTEERPD